MSFTNGAPWRDDPELAATARRLKATLAHSADVNVLLHDDVLERIRHRSQVRRRTKRVMGTGVGTFVILVMGAIVLRGAQIGLPDPSQLAGRPDTPAVTPDAAGSASRSERSRPAGGQGGGRAGEQVGTGTCGAGSVTTTPDGRCEPAQVDTNGDGIPDVPSSTSAPDVTSSTVAGPTSPTAPVGGPTTRFSGPAVTTPPPTTTSTVPEATEPFFCGRFENTAPDGTAGECIMNNINNGRGATITVVDGTPPNATEYTFVVRDFDDYDVIEVTGAGETRRHCTGFGMTNESPYFKDCKVVPVT